MSSPGNHPESPGASNPFIAACFRRPVAVTAFFLLVAVAALAAWVRVPVSLLPDLRYPTLVVWTAYPDVPPERVERAITERVEEAISGTQGVQRITARSMLGGSMIRLDFGWNVNLDLALLEVREQLDRLGDQLPDEAERPVVLRLDPNDRPIMILALSEAGDGASGRSGDLVRLKTVGKEIIARRLEQLGDVARVVVTGGFDRRVDVLLDPARLAAHAVDVTDIETALRRANVAQPGGAIRRGPFQYAVEVTGEFETIEDIADAIVARRGDRSLRLRDVADVREGVDERRGLVRLDGRETLMLLVERRPDANTVRAADEVRAALAEMSDGMPDVRVDVVIDESRFIQEAIGGVAQAVLLGGLLAIVVLFVFLRRRQALLAVAVAVPLSLGLTLVAFDALGVTFNLISLSGLALGVGMLVDNAIVVVENIARLRESGMPARKAGIQGTSEVAGAITASTLTTIAVFLPLTFVEGLAGRLFLDQSLAVITSLAASLIVGLTAVPLIAARDERVLSGLGTGLGLDSGPDVVAPAIAPASSGASRLVRNYERALTRALAKKGWVVAGGVLLVAAATIILDVLPREVVPRTNQGRLNLHVSLPADADLPLLDARSADLAAVLLQDAAFDHVLADLGERDEARLQIDPRPSYEGDLSLMLAPGVSLDEALDAARAAPHAADMTVEVTVVRTQLEELLASDESDLFIDLVADRREEAAVPFDAVLAALTDRPELNNVRRADAFNVPAYRLDFKRDALARYGVQASSITAFLEAGARGVHATDLRSINEDIPITLRTEGIGSIQQLMAQRVVTPGGPMPLSTFLTAAFVELPASLYRTDQSPVLRILADVAPGADLKSASGAAETVLAERLPDTVRGNVGGANEAFRNSLQAMLWSLLFSVVLVFLILAAQFESLTQPLVVLLTVPLAASGVAAVLAMTGQTINLMSLTGSVVLVGIVVNDAIVKVDFINQRRAAGLDTHAAILEAGRDRLRPILMTTITTVLGLLPLALGFGEGAELRAPMAIAIVGGLMAATVLTLFVVPVAYALVTRES
ncbi:MAG: efflux RND transporter permease subunit [Rhodothermales bacterium]